jgi:uncharacterized membrane protein YeaQ/YmgE (transglycosylase-associated protein family)
MDHPATGTGFFHSVVLGLSGALVALLIAQFFPTIIPARATAVKL